MTHKEYADGLRAIADWYEAHEEIMLPHDARIDITSVETKEQAITTARALGHCRKHYEDSLFIIERAFGCVPLRFLFWRSAVCTRRVVETVEEPEMIVPAHTREIVAWDCEPLLAETEDADA